MLSPYSSVHEVGRQFGLVSGIKKISFGLCFVFLWSKSLPVLWNLLSTLSLNTTSVTSLTEVCVRGDVVCVR